MHASYTNRTLLGLHSETFQVPTPVGPVDAGIKAYGDCKYATVEPFEIVMTCADYGWLLVNINWTNWTSTQATGIADQVYNDCNPSCANGHHHTIKDSRIVLDKPKRTPNGDVVWSEVTITPVPPGTRPGPHPLRLQPI
jgi:hypothetical protein